MGMLKVISLFSGCGGMDLGFEGGFTVREESVNGNMHPSWLSNSEKNGWISLPKTRFSTIFANDILPFAEKTWTTNFHISDRSGKVFYKDSIVDLVKSAWSGKFQFPKADVVTGGFPCQDFSLAGKRQGFSSKKSHNGDFLSNIDDPSVENRGMLYYWMRNVVELVLPNIFVAENVKGLVSLGETKEIIQHDFRNVGPGYIVADARVLNAKNFGVPQNRERVIFIGFRKDKLSPEALRALSYDVIDPFFDPYPIITHADYFDISNCNLPLLSTVAARTYLLDLVEPEYSTDPSHQNYSKAKWYGAGLQGNREIDITKVSPTIRSEHHGNIEFRRLSVDHGGKNIIELSQGLPERRLSVRECARLQTFPDDFKFVIKTNNPEQNVSGSDAYRLIGNAVPPLLAYHLAQRLSYLWPLLFEEDDGDNH